MRVLKALSIAAAGVVLGGFGLATFAPAVAAPAPAAGPAAAAPALSGQVESNEISIAPAMAGRISAVKVDEGAQVTKGAVLVQLDTAALKLQLGQARQGVTAAKAAVSGPADSISG